MNVRTRSTAAGALALFTAAAMATLASPAHAASGVDLSVTVDSSKIAIGAPVKPFIAKITNGGDVTAEGLQVEIDLADLDTSLVTASVGEDFADVCQPPADDKITCTFGGTLAGDETFEFPIFVSPVAGAKPGPAGEFTVTVQPGSDDDPADNNTATVPVELVSSGGDIVVLAQDVIADVGENGVVVPVTPGDTAAFFWAIFNFGDTAVQGLTFTVQLPEHVSFVDKFAGCTYSNGDRSVTCTDADTILGPNEAFGSGEEGWTVKVAADAPGPVNLKGTATGSASAAVVSTLNATTKSTTDAAWLKSEEVPADVDTGDNSDDFTVFVGAPPAAGGEGGGAGGGLPVTGVQVGLIGGIGGAVLVTGAVLFILARRRRVVLVTPGDETPTA
jgi:uncharacterized repeat protein (TIGR01451 family)